MAVRILIVEDEPIADDIKERFTLAGHHCDICRNVEEAIDCLDDKIVYDGDAYHILILDLELPEEKNKQPKKYAGLKVLEHIKENKLKMGKIVVSVHAKDPQSILEVLKRDGQICLAKEVDAFLGKAIDHGQLLLYVKNLHDVIFPDDNENCGDLSFDFPAQVCRVKGRQVELAKKEFRLLEYLYRNPNWVHRHSAIYNHVWDGVKIKDEKEDAWLHRLHQCIKRVRNAIAEQGGKQHIVTIPGIGYKFICEPDETE